VLHLELKPLPVTLDSDDDEEANNDDNDDKKKKDDDGERIRVSIRCKDGFERKYRVMNVRERRRVFVCLFIDILEY
jgi:hypothetical protein